MGIDNMIKINDNYYAKNAIIGITSIDRVKEDFVFYYKFKVYINMVDCVLEEIVIINDTDDRSLGIITYQHNSLIRKFEDSPII